MSRARPSRASLPKSKADVTLLVRILVVPEGRRVIALGFRGRAAFKSCFVRELRRRFRVGRGSGGSVLERAALSRTERDVARTMIAVETSVAFGIGEAALDGLATQLIMFFDLLIVHLRTLSIKQFLFLETLDRSTAGGMTAVSREKKLDSRVALHIMPEPRGHTTPRGSSKRAADWILEQFPQPAVASQPDATSESQPTARDLLFVDDHHILYRAGTERFLHPAELNPSNPVVCEDQAWEMAIGWTSIARNAETGKYQLWYQAYSGGCDDRKSHKCVVCYAESDDDVTSIKPMLTINDFKTERLP